MPSTAAAHQVKILSSDAGGFRVGGYGIVWGGQDVVGDYFDKSTDFWFDRLTQTPMVLYQHGGDGMVKRAVVGQVVAKRVDDTGLWIEAQITAAKKYADAIRALVEKGILGWSSGAVSYLVDRVKSGDRQRITSWPIAEFSLTPTPAEPRTLGVGMLKSLADLDAGLAGLLADDLEDGRLEVRRMLINDLPDSAFAYVEPGEKDSQGRTVPFTKRHFAHHGADGALDPELLAAAIAEAAASPQAAKALPHLLREQAGAGDAEAPPWREGVAADLLVLSHDLAALAERASRELMAHAVIGTDTKSGWLTGATLREDARLLAGRLSSLIDRAEGADTGADPAALADWWQLQHDLREVILSV